MEKFQVFKKASIQDCKIRNLTFSLIVSPHSSESIIGHIVMSRLKVFLGSLVEPIIRGLEVLRTPLAIYEKAHDHLGAKRGRFSRWSKATPEKKALAALKC